MASALRPGFFGRTSSVLTSALGFGGSLGLLGVVVMLGTPPLTILDPLSAGLVIGGTIAVSLASFSLEDGWQLLRLLGAGLAGKQPYPEVAAQDFVRLAGSLRAQDHHAFEAMAGRLGDRVLLSKGLRLIADNRDAAEINTLLCRQATASHGRNKRAVDLINRAAEVAPAMGLIGTLLGLVKLLGQLEDPTQIGPGMALALLTTLYGAILAHMVLVPLALRLEHFIETDRVLNECERLTVDAVRRRGNSRLLEAELNTLLPPDRQIISLD
ncbi:MAG: motility protein A [Geminicoccaceae bacterium]